MAMPCRLLLCQSPSPSGDPEAAFAEIGRALAVARAAGAGMAVFPELFLPGYNSERIAELAQPVDGDWSSRLAGMARDAGCGLVVGYAERAGKAVHNSTLAVGADGARLANYRKIQLYGPREKALFAPGGEYALFDLNGRKTALMICYDVEFAAHVAALAALGVELVLVPTANMHPYDHVARLTVPSQAINHGLALAYVNYCGTEGDLDYSGGTCLIGADGAVLATAGPGPALLIADLLAPDPALLSHQAADFRPVA